MTFTGNTDNITKHIMRCDHILVNLVFQRNEYDAFQSLQKTK